MADDAPLADGSPTDFTADLVDDELDAGLRAAFGVDGAASVVDRLEVRLGIRSSVMLADQADETGPPVRPLPNDVAAEDRARRYEIHGELARGGVGVILKGRDVDLGRDIAMKVLQDRHDGNPAMVRRFLEEAQITGQLQHPGILPVYELGLQADRRPFFTMKLIKGRTLAALLRERREPGDDLVSLLSIFEHVCQTMAYAHARGVIHRDLKPSNVMVGAFGEVQVVDWGLAKVLVRGGVADERPTGGDETFVQTVRTDHPGSRSLAGSIMGTPAYIAPEQARGEVERLDERTDVFALGGILCEMLTGAAPFSGTAAEMIACSAAGDLAPALARLEACGAERELVDLARACLAPDPRDRPATAGRVAELVTGHQASVQRRAREAEVEAAAARERAAHERRARRLAVLLAAAVLTAIVVAAAALLQAERSRAARIAAASDRVASALVEANGLFGEARATPAADPASFAELLASADRLRGLVDADDVDAASRTRAVSFLTEVDRARRDRLVIERIEELVVYGATHEDAESWLWMERQLRAAFLDYGLDLDHMTPVQVAERIRDSALTPQLTNGLELWVATVLHLAGWGVNPRPVLEMLRWVEALYVADTDPYRTAIRRLLYAPDPRAQADELDRLARSEQLETALPRTKSWLASIMWRAGDVERGAELLQAAVRRHPRDFMLAFDCAFYLVALERWEEAVRYYHRALALRPESAGVWRSLGRALRELGDLEESLAAFDESVMLQPGHWPAHVDRAETLRATGRLEEAEQALRRAIALDDDAALAHCHLGLVLQEQGRLDEALAALSHGHELGAARAHWPHPSAQWIAECEEEADRSPLRHGEHGEGAPRQE